LASVTVREMLDAGMHYGHHVSRWNPKMKPYIFGRRNLIHIINLRETLRGLVTAGKFVAHVVASGKSVVLVGTKRQAQRVVREEAIRCGMPFVTERWLGGTLTNFRTVRSRLKRLVELESIVESDAIQEHSKKEASRMRRELAKIKRNLDGIRNMEELPGAVVIIDPRREKNAVAEAQRLNIPTVCLADTDCDPDAADVLVPANDDAMRAIEIFMRLIADATLAGKEKRRERSQAEAAAAIVQAAPDEKKAAEAPAASAGPSGKPPEEKASRPAAEKAAKPANDKAGKPSPEKPSK